MAFYEEQVYPRVLALVQKGDWSDATKAVNEYIARDPRNGQAWNDLGVIFYHQAKVNDAIECFNKAIPLMKDPSQVCLNLVEAYIRIDRADLVVGIIDSISRSQIPVEDVVRHTSQVLIETKNLSDAMKLALEAVRLSPQNEQLSAIAEQIRSDRAKIAFFCGGDGPTFLKDIYQYAQDRYQVRLFEGTNAQQMAELMNWSDISWFEWCTNLAEIGSKLPKVCKNIVRLHRYEAYLDWPAKINWDNVDVLITVGNSSVNQMLNTQVPDIARRTSIVTIPNGVDLDRINFTDRVQGKNLAFIGNMRMVKNPMLLLQCFKKLWDIDKQYRLFIAGQTQDIEVQQYIVHMIKHLGLNNAVVFDGWQDDIQSWLCDKHYIVCTSVIESQGMGVLEAMAMGLKPVVHNFPGAAEIFGTEFVFNTPQDFCEQIISGPYMPQKYRFIAEQRYPLDRQLIKINEIFTSFEEDILPVENAGQNTELPKQQVCVNT